jgi:hypothetical protein
MNGDHRVIRLIFAVTRSRSNHESATQAGVIASSLHSNAGLLYRSGRWDWLRTGSIGPTGWCPRCFFHSRYPDVERRRRSPDLRTIHDSNLGRYLQCCQRCGRGVQVDPSDVKGLGFDATCSLAVTDMAGPPSALLAAKSRPGRREKYYPVGRSSCGKGGGTDQFHGFWGFGLRWWGNERKYSASLCMMGIEGAGMSVHFTAGDGDTEDSLAQESYET